MDVNEYFDYVKQFGFLFKKLDSLLDQVIEEDGNNIKAVYDKFLKLTEEIEKIVQKEKKTTTEVSNETKKYKIKDKVKFNGYEWYVMKNEDGLLTLIMKNALPVDMIKKYFEGYSEYYDVPFNKEANSDWINSSIRKGLIKFAENEFKDKGLELMTTNYDQDRYANDYIRLITIRETEQISKKMRQLDGGNFYWTMSPVYIRKSKEYAYVFGVSGSTGRLDYGYTVNSYGVVRPVVCLRSDNPYIEELSEV